VPLVDRIPPSLQRFLDLAHVDWSPPRRQPAAWRVVLATVVALAGSLLADALLVALGTRVFPATKGYVHFAPGDYGKLTVIGVLIACAAWPVVTRVTSTPRWLFLRLAVAVTAVLLLPDVYLLVVGQPPKAVAVLMCMHLAIAVVTYNAVVRLAPAGDPARPRHVADRRSGRRATSLDA
jgi:hypothetical protein